VTADGDTYLDGGAFSATNADLLADFDLDVVIVVSPMTGDDRRTSVSRLVRRSCRRTLDDEIRSLRHHGLPTVVIEPGRSVTRHMSMDFMSELASVPIVRSAFFDTGAQITTNPLLRGLQVRKAA
jgi:NTE family protein